jgi:hypothetical protein
MRLTLKFFFWEGVANVKLNMVSLKTVYLTFSLMFMMTKFLELHIGDFV